MRALFAEHGLRCTQQRASIYRALAGSEAHPTADALYRQVSKELAGVSLATVYNTLEAFCRAGLVQKLPGAGENGSARYDAVRENHLHLRCQKTGAVEDVPEALSRQILKQIPAARLAELEKRLGFKITQVQIELIGEHKPQRAAV